MCRARDPLLSLFPEGAEALSNSYPGTSAPPAVPPNPQWPGSTWTLGWNHRSYLELSPDDRAPGYARDHVASRLKEWGLPDHMDLSLLFVSELVTNSAAAVRGCPWEAEPPPVRVWVLGGTGRVKVLVWDGLTVVPAPREAGPEDENGRGLFLVRELSRDCGWYQPPESYAPDYRGGKVTWAVAGPG
jgi:hypothetical protein